jgi:SAM-dependent methyltransferase
MALGSFVAAAIRAAAQLGIADLLQDGPRSCESLAKATGTHEPSLYRLLRALAGEGVFAEGPDRCFQLTPLGACLRTGVAGSVRQTAMLFNNPWHSRSFEEIHSSLVTGEPAFDRVYGTGVFQYLASHPEESKGYDEAMSAATAGVVLAVLLAYRSGFSGIERLVDVAGGQGHFLIEILTAHPHMKGVIFDQPHVIDGARQAIQAAGLSERCEAIAGDFFTSLPADADAYILKNILHDWDDEHAAKILTNCHRAMRPNGKLLVVEWDLRPASAAATGNLANLLDLEMLLTTGGRERTEEEHRALLATCGFALTRVIPTRAGYCIVEGERIDPA